MTSGGESERLFEAYSIPSPARPLFQTAFGNLNRRSPTAMDTQNPDRGPLLLISCQKTTWSQTSPPVPITSSMANRRP
jgi:hypothetical protein